MAFLESRYTSSLDGPSRRIRSANPLERLTLIVRHGFARQGRVLELRHGHVGRSTHPTGPGCTRLPAPRPRAQRLRVQVASCHRRRLRGGHHTTCHPRKRTRAARQHRRCCRPNPTKWKRKQERTFVLFPRTSSCETLQPKLHNTTDNNATDAWLLGARSVRICFHFARVCRCLRGWECATTKYVALCE